MSDYDCVLAVQQALTWLGQFLAVLSLYWIPRKDTEPMVNEDERLGHDTGKAVARLSGMKEKDPHKWMLGAETQGVSEDEKKEKEKKRRCGRCGRRTVERVLRILERFWGKCASWYTISERTISGNMPSYGM